MLLHNHPLRLALANEVHARPPELLEAPLRLSYLAVYSDWSLRDAQWQQVCELARLHDVKPPAPDANHFSADLGRFRVKWERHAEFARYKFIAQGAGEPMFEDTALRLVPEGWVRAIPGEILVATHAVLLGGTSEDPDSMDLREEQRHEALSHAYFGGNALVGAEVAGGAASAFTDFRIHRDGFSRVLVIDRGMTRRQAGRTIQRLVEIDTYRMLALLAFPVARDLMPVLGRSENELAEITAALDAASDADEQPLLARLTALEAATERRQAENSYRFSAAIAYHELVQRRTSELREQRIQGLQTFQEFIERRLTPAMNTCRTAASRQEALSLRVSRVSQLLSTRVDLTHERQNQALLASMDRRARLQLRLQETVEGLSVAAITYYIIGLIGYGTKSLHALGLPVSPELVTGLAIPVVALLLALGVRKTRRLVQGQHEH